MSGVLMLKKGSVFYRPWASKSGRKDSFNVYDV